MGTWGPGNFDSDQALDRLDEVTRQLADDIGRVLADENNPKRDAQGNALWSAADWDEEGESTLMPTVEMLCVLLETVGGHRPDPDVVERWKAKKLAVFDAQAESMGARPGFLQERRRVIVETFDRLYRLTKRVSRGY